MRRPPDSPPRINAHASRTLLVSLALTVGCYNGEELVERVRNQAIRTRLEEIEIGAFRVTLPRDEVTGDMTEIDLRIFGESHRYKLKRIGEELEAKAPLVEDRALQTLRETERAELIEPELIRLRERLLAAINPLIEGEPLEAIGFSEIRILRH